MKKLFMLIDDELKRNLPMMSICVFFLILGEIITVIKNVYQIQQDNNLEVFGLNQVLLDSNLFHIVLSMGMLFILLFSIFTWIREWNLKGRFIYRLMMLPEDKAFIGLAKWISMLLMTGILIFIQIVIFIGMDMVLNVFIKEYTAGWMMSYLDSTGILTFIVPYNLSNYLMLMLIVSLVILIVFNVILLYFSLPSMKVILKFILTGTFALLLVGIIFGSQLLVVSSSNLFDYEMMIFTSIMMVLFNVILLIIMTHLIRHKVKV